MHDELGMRRGEVEALELLTARDSSPGSSRGCARDGDGRKLSDDDGDGNGDGDDDVTGSAPYTAQEERSVRAKLDRKLVLFVALLYLLSFLDRSNIGNARIAGMDEDLQTEPRRDDWCEWALTAFYLAYIAFEWMSLLWRVVPAHLFVSVTVLSWGLVASLQSVAPSYPILIALRVLLGVAEAVFAGVPVYLSFFRREELAFRTAIFISAAPLATSFASTLAWVIVKLAELTPIAPWRLLFLVEGLPSVLVSAVAWSAIPDAPEKARFLSSRERAITRQRLRALPATASGPASRSAPQPESREIIGVLVDPAAWLTAAMLCLANLAYSSLPVFLPKMLTEMGHSALTSQALSAPPYLLSFPTVVTAYLSDRWQNRATPIVFYALASGGYATLALASTLHLSPLLRYWAVFPAAVGFFNVVTLIIAWSINNQASTARRGGGFALLQVIGQCGPLLGTRLYPGADAPYYTRGMLTCAGAMLTVAVLAALLRMHLIRRNRQLAALNEKYETEDGATDEARGLFDSGKRGPRIDAAFRYIL